MVLAVVNRSPGSLANGTSATALTTALVAGTPVTSLAVSALPQALASGATIQIGHGPSGFDVATLSAPANQGATAIAVTSYDPTVSWAIGTPVAPNQLVRTSLALGWPGDTNGPASAEFACALTDGVNLEVVYVTGGQGTTALTVVRAAEPVAGASTPITVVAGSSLAPTLTAAAVGTLTAGVFNVLDYGATGNGSTDDTAAIQRTVTAAAAWASARGAFSAVAAAVYFPNGRYFISAQIATGGQTLVMVGDAVLHSWITSTQGLRYPSGIIYAYQMETGGSNIPLFDGSADMAFENLGFDPQTGGSSTYAWLVPNALTINLSFSRVSLNCELATTGLVDAYETQFWQGPSFGTGSVVTTDHCNFWDVTSFATVVDVSSTFQSTMSVSLAGTFTTPKFVSGSQLTIAAAATVQWTGGQSLAAGTAIALTGTVTQFVLTGASFPSGGAAVIVTGTAPTRSAITGNVFVTTAAHALGFTPTASAGNVGTL